MMEALTALSAQRAGAGRAAVRLVNVLGKRRSATELWVRQARAGVPLTLTDPQMQRYWITKAHAASLLAHGCLASDAGARLLTAAEPVELSVGVLAQRIWSSVADAGSEPALHVTGVRPGETMSEVLVGPDEAVGGELHQGAAEILGGPTGEMAAAVVAEVEVATDEHERRRAWLLGACA